MSLVFSLFGWRIEDYIESKIMPDDITNVWRHVTWIKIHTVHWLEIIIIHYDR